MRAIFGILLSLLNLAVWGTWPAVREKCRAEGPVFAPLYFVGQLFGAIVLGSILNQDMFTSGMQGPASYLKVMALFLGGFLVGNGDFLCACACTKIPFSIAFPVYAGMY